MTLFFKNRYRIDISDISTEWIDTLMGSLPISVVNINLYRNNFFYNKKLLSVKIELSSNHKLPFPQPSFRTFDKCPIMEYIDHPKLYENNIDRYVKIISNNISSFNISDNFSYKSYIREQRFKKLLDN